MREGEFLRKLEMKGRNREDRGSGVSRFIKDSDYNGVCRWIQDSLSYSRHPFLGCGVLPFYRRILSAYCHHHNVMPVAWISLTLSCHSSLSSIAPGRSSRLHPARPCEGVHRGTALMCSSLFFQQCPACLVRLIWLVFEIGGWWLYSCCSVEYYVQDLFNTARNILV